MKIKPEDRPKMFGLLAAISLMFCYLILVVVPSLSGAQAAPAAQETPGTTTIAPAAATVTPASVSAPAPSKSSVAVMDAGPVPDAAHDPFLSPAPTPVSAAPAVSPAPSTATGAGKPVQAAAKTPPAVASQTTPQTAPKVPLPALMLLGVAGGDEPVAVFQAGESTLEKKQGDTLPGGFTLQTIDGEGVTLTRGKAVFRLEVGHTFTGS